ncbi:hypothetical protein ASPZODRAFT_2129457 [Penicilliopsis zonata CBS 506.65]|uniref:DUF6536 domain-containing protein n=1 Tax=Penicilliopsis zonata CBS 506.65 TaxID=1073090 RepID=A0A1L9SH28_9EURO|nr:hypothetical protein ASPZODRAFT_2129457 [Penicilliopsis zonata CBS 506.65]OJJ46443.1 hypothetical protein ASPZODRAFT_2129457 [Penicilliopsis zonata CBS 506.65]
MYLAVDEYLFIYLSIYMLGIGKYSSHTSLESTVLILMDRSENNKNEPKWIRGVYLCAQVSSAIFLLNTILLAAMAILSRRYPSEGDFSSSLVAYRGDCDVAERWNTALHVIINILSTVILAASNYCMQRLVAPTREEIDARHAQFKWLDIGSGSIRNLFIVNRYRCVLALLLLITTTPFHLLYNSMVFHSWAIGQYTIVLAPHDLNSTNVQDLTTPALQECFAPPNQPFQAASSPPLSWTAFASTIRQGNYQRLSIEQCQGIIYGEWNDGVRLLVLLGDNLTVSQGGDAAVRFAMPVDTLTYNGSNHLHSVALTTSFSTQENNSSQCTDTTPFADALPGTPGLQEYPFSECLAVRSHGNCEARFSPLIATAISLATLVKVTVMFLAARIGRGRARPLLTIGDAIHSFLQHPDPTTQGLCWMSKADLGASHAPAAGYSYLRPFSRDALRNFQATNLKNQESIKTHPGLHSLGTLIAANLPQLAVTLISLGYSNILASILAAAEYSSYGAAPKPLRVTWPAKDSEQQSTYLLGMPFKYSLPLLIGNTALHWLASQSMFFAVFIPYTRQGQMDTGLTKSFICISTTAIALGAILLALMVCILGVLAFRRFSSEIPIAGSCSAAISAACHPARNEDSHTVALGVVMWGETTQPALRDAIHDSTGTFSQPSTQTGHCSFTSFPAVRPRPNKLYA